MKFICLYSNCVYNTTFFLENDETDTDVINPEGDKDDIIIGNLCIVNRCEGYIIKKDTTAR